MDLSIISLIAQATVVGQVVLLILLLMSVLSWAMMFQKWIAIRLAMKKTVLGSERFHDARELRNAVHSIGRDMVSPLYVVAHEGVTEFNRSKEAGNSEEVIVENVRRALRQGVSTEMTRLSSSLSFLATTANTAPFIGLFGTIWGIMHTFHSIGAMKSASLATVAPGISEALIATAFGLAVAIPATVGYNIFVGKLGDLESKLVNFAGMFLNRVHRELNANKT
ncbi:protein TolQ [Lawsonia intracellularis]|nr:protein TolQ [Lawsonia intracellularis]AGC50118.1 MotA/TolQ/ExbB proton channel [Lawsonia intracellularis N343]KAA0204813.1 protein TolQ [Lawsonia intracellularis]MBZ3892556.1 protein TolQ [Lawsonia intracellularis]OMQ03263.1 protein TolQ [Lawsonia intracellularis]RBN33272.1 protein TolQ [Lawsonia intracellularis]